MCVICVDGAKVIQFLIITTKLERKSSYFISECKYS